MVLSTTTPSQILLFSGEDGIERGQQKHPADAKADEHRLGVLYLTAGFAIDVKANDCGNGQYHREKGRPAVGMFQIPGKGRRWE